MPPLLPAPVRSTLVHRAICDRIKIGHAELNGYRTEMDDAHLIHCTRELVVLGIFDGHGGSACSRFIADRLPSLLPRTIEEVQAAELVRICLRLDAEFIRDFPKEECGSTATFVIIEHPRKRRTYEELTAFVCNVGDSRTLILRNGQVHFATSDHVPSKYQELKRIEAQGGYVLADRVDSQLSVSRAIGDCSYKKADFIRKAIDVSSLLNDKKKPLHKQKVIAVPDVKKLSLRPKDAIILVCDGVLERKPGFPDKMPWQAETKSIRQNKRLCNFVLEQMQNGSDLKDLALVSASVVQASLNGCSCDNISCMIGHIRGSDRDTTPIIQPFIPLPPVRNFSTLTRFSNTPNHHHHSFSRSSRSQSPSYGDSDDEDDFVDDSSSPRAEYSSTVRLPISRPTTTASMRSNSTSHSRKSFTFPSSPSVAASRRSMGTRASTRHSVGTSDSIRPLRDTPISNVGLSPCICTSEFIPGRFTFPNHSGFVRCYNAMAKRAGLSHNASRRARYDILKQWNEGKLTPLQDLFLSSQTTSELRREFNNLEKWSQRQITAKSTIQHPAPRF